MATYNVGISNIFAALGDGEGPQQKVEKAEAKDALPRKGVAAPMPDKQVEPQKPRVKVEDRNKDGGSQRGRGGRGRGRGRGAPREGHRQFDRRGAPRSTAPGQPRKNGFGLGPQGGQLDEDNVDQKPPHATKTEFDAPEPAAEAAAGAGAPEAGAATDAAPADAEAPAEDAPQFDVEVDTNQTYDEWLAAQKAKAPEDDLKVEVRAVSNDEKQWKKFKEFVPKKLDGFGEEVAGEGEDDEESEAAKKKKANKNKKNVVHLAEFVGPNAVVQPAPRRDFQPRGDFQQPRGDFPLRERREFVPRENSERGGGEFRGRGRGRGGRGAPAGAGAGGDFRGRGRGGAFRGGDRPFRGRGGYHHGSEQVNLTDESSFPKLGAAK